MADTGINISEGSGQVIDTRTEGTNSNHRQVVVLGDPATNAGVAPVDATNGLAVDNKTLPPGASTSALQTTLNGYVDQIEGYVDQIEGYVDGIEGSLTTISGNVDQLEGYVDGIEGSLTTVAGAIRAEDAAHVSADTGIMALGVRNDNAATAISGTNGDYTPQGVDSAGASLTSPRPATAATLTNVSSSASSVSLLASTAGRKGAIIFNDSTAILYVKFGATASATSFTYKLSAGDTLELPVPIYTGAIDGIWASANGSARITEIT